MVPLAKLSIISEIKGEASLTKIAFSFIILLIYILIEKEP